MAQILNRFEVTEALMTLVEEAEHEIVLISPYIKLNDVLKKALLKHKSKASFKLILVYGKNEEDKRLSLSEKDYEFLQQFPSVEIRYHKRLHAKLYANDFDCLITSMNLHDYSIKQNIEVGILLKMNLLRDIGSFFSRALGNSLEDQAREFADYIISKSEVHVKKEGNKEQSFFRAVTTYGKPSIQEAKRPTGYCIRTGKQIPFNIDKPLSNEAYKSWSEFGNPSYPEKYCHFSGELSNGETSARHPILKKYWYKAKEWMNR